ncbi:MAG: HAD-IIB family hydrolase [Prochloraceae cyanobacterium]
MSLIVFTDLDGTFLNQDDYKYDAAIPMVEKLKKRKIPVIPVTSKTRQEVETLRTALDLQDPFIVENGSGAFVPIDNDRFALPETEAKDYYLELFGCDYPRARDGLKKVAEILGEDLRGFADLRDEEIQELTGLSLEEVKLAKAREFTEPFLTPGNIAPEKLKEVVASLGFRVVVGDRFSHLISKDAGKGKAAKWLEKQYLLKSSANRVVTVGLGNSPNDLDLLEVVDYPIIIPGKKGPHSGLAGRGWEVASAPGSEGWAIAMAKIYSQFIV